VEPNDAPLDIEATDEASCCQIWILPMNGGGTRFQRTLGGRPPLVVSSGVPRRQREGDGNCSCNRA
jgi:hypothetical protein